MLHVKFWIDQLIFSLDAQAVYRNKTLKKILQSPNISRVSIKLDVGAVSLYHHL